MMRRLLWSGLLWFALVTTGSAADDDNHAPEIDAGAGMHAMAPLRSDDLNNAGSPVADLIGDTVNDSDNGAKSGLAVTSVDSANGMWQFSLDGGETWRDFGVVADNSATLLDAVGNSGLRFVPNADYVGDATIEFRAWDQTGGDAGDTNADTSINGGGTPFSANTNLAQVKVATEPEQGGRWAGQLTSAVRDNPEQAQAWLDLAVKTQRSTADALEAVLRGLPSAEMASDLFEQAIDLGLDQEGAEQVVENLRENNPCP